MLSSSFLEYILARAAPPIPNPISSGNKLYDRGRNFFAFSLSTIDLFIFFSKPTPNLSYCVITSYFCHIVRGLKFLTSESGYVLILPAINFLESWSSYDVNAKPCIFNRLSKFNRSKFLLMSSSTTRIASL